MLVRNVKKCRDTNQLLTETTRVDYMPKYARNDVTSISKGYVGGFYVSRGICLCLGGNQY